MNPLNVQLGAEPFTVRNVINSYYKPAELALLWQYVAAYGEESGLLIETRSNKPEECLVNSESNPDPLEGFEPDHIALGFPQYFWKRCELLRLLNR